MALDFRFLNSPKARIVLITVRIAEQLRRQLQACFLRLAIFNLRHALRTFHDSPLMRVM